MAVGTLEQHAVGSLGRSLNVDLVTRVAGAGHGAFRIQKITVLRDEANGRLGGFQVRIGTKLVGRLFDQSQPGCEIGGREVGQWFDHVNDRGFGKIVYRFVHFVLLERCLLGGQRFPGGFVRAIGSEPETLAQGKEVVSSCEQVRCALSGSEIAVLFVISEADDDAQQSSALALPAAKSAKDGAGVELVSVVTRYSM